MGLSQRCDDRTTEGKVKPKQFANDDAVIAYAIKVMESRAAVYHEQPTLTSPDTVRDYLRLKLFNLEHEEFHCVWLDSQHRVLLLERMFRGTVGQTSVYPREVVKSALKVNAAAVIFAHNHPSGVAEPSRADELLTAALKNALAMIDVRVLDHFVVAGDMLVSFSERGIL